MTIVYESNVGLLISLFFSHSLWSFSVFTPHWTLPVTYQNTTSDSSSIRTFAREIFERMPMFRRIYSIRRVASIRTKLSSSFFKWSCHTAMDQLFVRPEKNSFLLFWEFSFDSPSTSIKFVNSSRFSKKRTMWKKNKNRGAKA